MSKNLLDSSREIPLVVENIRKTFKTKSNIEVKAVQGVSFELKPGEIFALLGPNGAGKTTCINMVTTLEKLDEGDIRVFGHSVRTEPLLAKKNFGVVHQELVSHGFFTIEEILGFYSGYYGILDNKQQIDYLLFQLGLEAHRKKLVKQLSGGMKRRLMIAKALVHRPQLLLLDEPTAGVDVELRTSLWKFVKELKEKGMTILLTTHYLQEAEELCDRVGILDSGKLKYYGATRNVIEKLTKKRVELVLRTPPSDVARNHPLTLGVDGNTISLAIPSTMTLGSLWGLLQINPVDVMDLKSRDGTLEEAFLSVVQGGLL